MDGGRWPERSEQSDVMTMRFSMKVDTARRSSETVLVVKITESLCGEFPTEPDDPAAIALERNDMAVTHD